MPVVGEWASDPETVDFGAALFRFCRALKAHPQFASLDAVTAYERAVAALDDCGASLPDLDEVLDGEDGEVAFAATWERVRIPAGIDPVARAVTAAGDGCLRTHVRRPGRYARFLTVAALLQIQVGQRPILLPVHLLAEHLGCKPETIGHWVRWATDDGVLLKVREHVYRPGGRGRAAEYVFGLHRWDGPTIERLGDRLAIPIRPRDIGWTEGEFAQGGAP